MLDALATPVGIVIRTIHAGLSTVLDPASGLAWGLSIVLLTVTVRLVLFPLFVKQIKSQRRMQEIAPMVKELQKKHKGDRETLNTELMKLYRENNANPISGCLPLLLQLPVFFALFHVIRHFGPGQEESRFGLSPQLLEEGGRAQIFGAPVAANFRSTAGELAELGAGSSTTVRVVAAVMVVMMGATTYWTQRQMIARAGATDPQQIMIQKFLLYVLPLSFAVSGVIFPVGVLLYWVTTNVWSMGQQAYVIKRMPPPVRPGETRPGTSGAGGKPGGSGGKPGGPGGNGPGGNGPGGKGPGGRGGSGGKGSGPPGPPAAAAAAPSGAGTGSTRPAASRPAGAPKGRAAGARRNKNRKGGRR
ncbi:MAG TPA: membrane protein insertase YidC [Mycobacteriales bacterium]|nr:membrane protein insertase YidC [Mycobacteriales bacterium]